MYLYLPYILLIITLFPLFLGIDKEMIIHKMLCIIFCNNTRITVMKMTKLFTSIIVIYHNFKYALKRSSARTECIHYIRYSNNQRP